MMKHLHTITLSIILALSITAVHAQDDDDNEDHWNGIRAGYHLSNLTGDESFDARSGFYGGFYRNLIKIPLYRLSVGGEFNTAGASVETTELRLSYVSLPVNNRVKLGPFYADLGLAVALKVGEKVLEDGEEVDIEDDAKAEQVDVLLHGGVGFKIAVISVEARYRYGLMEVYDGYRNTGVQVGLSLFF